MSIEDSNPERRNLMVLSTSIIVYYLAGGVIVDDQLTLELVNIKFAKGWVLQIFIWMMLLWFGFRYWIENRETLIHEFMASCHGTDYFLKFIGPLILMKRPDYKLKFKGLMLVYYWESPSMQRYSPPMKSLAIGRVGANGGIDLPMRPIEIGDFWKFLLYPLLASRLLFIDSNISRNIFPIVLALIALIILAYHQIANAIA